MIGLAIGSLLARRRFPEKNERSLSTAQFGVPNRAANPARERTSAERMQIRRRYADAATTVVQKRADLAGRRARGLVAAEVKLQVRMIGGSVSGRDDPGDLR